MKFLSALLVLSFCSTAAFAGHRPCWTPAGEVKKEKEVKPLTESDFTSMLSSYYRKRFSRFSPAQKKGAMGNFMQGMTPDGAVDHVSFTAFLRS